MNDKDRIAELERRVLELERRPHFVLYPPVFAPVYQPTPPSSPSWWTVGDRVTTICGTSYAAPPHN